MSRYTALFTLLCSFASALAPVVAAAADSAAQEPSPDALSRDLMVVVSRPNTLHVIDLKAREVRRSCELPGAFGPGTVVMNPQGSVAYALTNHFENVYGVAIDSCDLVFSAKPSGAGLRIKSIASIAISADGAELYVHQNPTRLLRDRYEVLESRVAVYDTAAGLDAAPARLWPAPRQVTIMAAGADGTVYLGGRDIHALNTETGELSIALASQSRNDPLETPRDVLSVWPLGAQNREMVRMYSAGSLPAADAGLEDAQWVWGYERIDLDSGETESRVFGPLEVVLFSGMARPTRPEQFYGVLTQLKKFDVATRSEVASVDLEHSYYCINFSTSGDEIYLAGTFNDIAIYDPDTLEKRGNIVLPGGDMSLANTQVFARAP